MSCIALAAGCSRDSACKEDRPVEGRIVAPDGVAVRYQVCGEGEPSLVFIHGWSCDRSVWRHQWDYFKKEHKVAALDLPGHGKSLGFHRRAWTMEAYGGDVAAVVRELNLTNVILVGHSMGGAVMIEAAREMPNRVTALIGVDTLHDVDEHMSDRAIRQFIEPLRAEFKEGVESLVRRSYFVRGTDPDLVDSMAELMRSSPPPVALGAMEELFRYDAAEALNDIEVPIRCINSDLYPTDVAAGTRHAGDFKVLLMRGLGHFPMLEEPTLFNELLEAVIEEVQVSRLTLTAEPE